MDRQKAAKPIIEVRIIVPEGRVVTWNGITYELVRPAILRRLPKSQKRKRTNE